MKKEEKKKTIDIRSLLAGTIGGIIVFVLTQFLGPSATHYGVKIKDHFFPYEARVNVQIKSIGIRQHRYYNENECTIVLFTTNAESSAKTIQLEHLSNKTLAGDVMLDSLIRVESYGSSYDTLLINTEAFVSIFSHIPSGITHEWKLSYKVIGEGRSRAIELCSTDVAKIFYVLTEGDSLFAPELPFEKVGISLQVQSAQFDTNSVLENIYFERAITLYPCHVFNLSLDTVIDKKVKRQMIDLCEIGASQDGDIKGQFMELSLNSSNSSEYERGFALVCHSENYSSGNILIRIVNHYGQKNLEDFFLGKFTYRYISDNDFVFVEFQQNSQWKYES